MHILDFSAFWAKRSGFSLIEITVSFGIIMILSLIVFTFGRNVQNSLVLNAASSKLVALIGRSKSLAQQFSANAPTGYEICGYGVHVDSAGGKIFIFRDLVSNPDKDTTKCDLANSFFDSGEELEGELNNMNIDQNALFIVTPETNLSDIVFIPPDPTVIINASSSNTSGLVVLGIKNTTPTVTAGVRVNNFGQISVE